MPDSIHDRRLPYSMSDFELKFFEKEMPDRRRPGEMTVGMALVMDTGTSRQVAFVTKADLRGMAEALIKFLDANPRTNVLTVATQIPPSPTDGRRP